MKGKNGMYYDCYISINQLIFSKLTIGYKQFSTFICYGFSQPYRKASGTGQDASDFHNCKQ